MDRIKSPIPQIHKMICASIEEIKAMLSEMPDKQLLFEVFEWEGDYIYGVAVRDTNLVVLYKERMLQQSLYNFWIDADIDIIFLSMLIGKINKAIDFNK